MKKTSVLAIICLLLAQHFFVYSQNTEIQYLSGVDKDNIVVWDFKIDSGLKCCKWSTIAVPSNWELQGFGRYNYGRDLRKDELPANETGIYRYNFDVPKRWKNKVVKIVFEGVMTDAQVFINGKKAGPEHQGGFYRFAYDISKLIRYNKSNQLEVIVRNQSSNSSINAAERESDYWIFSGIFRPVYLKAMPQQHIEALAIDAEANGLLTASITLKNISGNSRAVAQIFDMSDNPVGSEFEIKIEKGQKEGILKSHINNIKPWNPEFPNLYMLEIMLKDDQTTMHSIRQPFGFRTVELRKGEGIYVNNVKIMFKGVNRHSFWPESGRCLSKEISIKDVNLIKDMNMNAVRMSHYPPDTHFLDVCDSLGLFVLDELAGWQDFYDTKTGKRLVREMVLRDVNHPSIILWDNGNEGGHNFELDDDFALYDPQNRPVIHPQHIFRGTDTQHYKDYDCCTGSLFHGREVFFPTEFLHGLYDGGLGAGLEDYWDLMRANPLSAGGFLWVFADEGVVRVDKNGIIDTHGNNAPDGIVGPYHEKEGSFYTIKELWSPIVINKKYIDPGFSGKLLLENRYFYSNLSECSLIWQLSDIAPDTENKLSQKIYKSETIRLPDTPPGSTADIGLKLPEGYRNHDILSLQITDRYSREIYNRSWPLKTPEAFSRKMIHLSNDINTPVTVEEESKLVTAKAGIMTYIFNKKTGLLEKILRNGQHLSFGGGPITSIGSTEYEGLTWKIKNGSAIISLHYKEKIHRADFIIEQDGLLLLKFAYQPGRGKTDYLGINFSYPENLVTGVKWVGNGPYRVWKNRMKGPQFGYWEKEYNNTITGERDWIYPEFKGYFSSFYQIIIDSKEFPFKIFCQSEDVFLRLFTPEAPHGALNKRTDGLFPPGDISFMHAITPIGTKFTDADRLGLQGAKNIISGTGSSKRYLHFDLIFDFR